MVNTRSPIRSLGRRAVVVAVASIAMAAFAPAIANATVVSDDCNADGQWFRTDTWYSSQSNGYWFIDQVKLTLENNTSNENDVRYWVVRAADGRQFFAYRSDNFPGRRTVTVQVDTLASRSAAVYVQAWVRADQTIDSECTTPGEYL